MESCDVAIVGGGPAGSACAWSLHRAGLDVVVLDKAVFPRDKVCAGWITPAVLDRLCIDPLDYASRRTLQPITSFRIGAIGQRRAIDVAYPAPVSFAIRRSEFDQYLIERSGVNVRVGTAVTSVRREGSAWIVNDAIRARLLVGAGGHFCPVARAVDATRRTRRLIVAQEVEVPIRGSRCEIDPDRPEIYFATDLAGYGWCLRKGWYLNVGLGRFEGRELPAIVARFVRFLQQIGRVSTEAADWKWRGHAYAVGGEAGPLAGDGFVLVGDAAGLARPLTGEGIRPAIESGLLAADAIVDARGTYSAERLAAYAAAVRTRFAPTRLARALRGLVPPAVIARAAFRLLDRPWFVRRVVVDRWFLDAA